MADNRIVDGSADLRVVDGGTDQRIVDGSGAAAATAITLSGPSSSSYNQASPDFTAGANGAIIGIVTVTPTSSAGTGSFTPTTVQISSGTPTATFTYTGTSVGARNINATNDGGLSAPSDVALTVNAVAPDAPTIGTATASTDGSGEFTVTFTPPAETGGAAIIDYSVVSETGGLSATVSGSPATVTGGAAGTAYQFKVRARNSAGSGAYSSLTSAVTATGFCPTFDGTGGTYFTLAAPTDMKTLPIGIGAWVRQAKDRVRATVYTVAACERTTRASGYWMHSLKHGLEGGINQASDSSFSKARSAQAIIPNPYVEHVFFQCNADGSQDVYINGVLEKQNATTKTLDLSTGSPVWRIGINGAGTNPFKGEIFDVTVIIGTASGGDITTLATVGADYSTVADHWYKLDGNGNDSVGSQHMSASGTVSYIVKPANPSAATRADLIEHIFTQATIRSETPTITASSLAGLDDYSTLTGVASVEKFSSAFTGAAGAWNASQYHLIKSGATHVVVLDGGHALRNEAADYGMDLLAQDILDDGHSVLLHSMPGYDPDDPGADQYAHDLDWVDFEPGVENKMERYFGPLSIAINDLASRYDKVSVVGLSGGGWLAAHYPALDPRVGIGVSIRGTLPARRRFHTTDFEQTPAALGRKSEDYWKLCVQGRLTGNNGRLWIITHPDDTYFAQLDGGAGGSDDAGAYLSAASMISTFVDDPIAAAYPSSDAQFIEETTGTAGVHEVTADVRDLVLTALSASLSGEAPYSWWAWNKYGESCHV